MNPLINTIDFNERPFIVIWKVATWSGCSAALLPDLFELVGHARSVGVRA